MSDSSKGREPRSVLTAVLFAIWALLMIGFILFKLPFNYDILHSGRELNLIPLAGTVTAGGKLHLDEIVENVLVFVPFGAYLSMLWRTWSFPHRLVLIVATTVAFEVIQYVFAIGRSDITDVLSNTLGGVIGIGIYAALVRLLGRRTIRVLNIVGLVLTVAVLLEFGFLFWVSNIRR